MTTRIGWDKNKFVLQCSSRSQNGRKCGSPSQDWWND
jgi:hypothetical protein